MSGRALVNGQDLQHVEETDGRDWTDLDLPLIQRSGLVGVGDQADRDFRRVQRLDARAAVVQEPIRDDFLAARNRRRALRAAVLEAQHARLRASPVRTPLSPEGSTLASIANVGSVISVTTAQFKPRFVTLPTSASLPSARSLIATPFARPLSTSTVRCHSDAGPR